MSQNRNWCFTLNNYTDAEYETIINLSCKYVIVGKEVGEKGTPHLQGYIEFNAGKRLTTMKKLIPRAHFEIRRGTAEQAATYCKKDGNYTERGTISQQGKRTDLNAIKEEIMNGKKVDDLLLENPELYHQYGRTLERIEELRHLKEYRTEMTKGTWLWGATGVGKTHRALEGFHPDTHYIYPNDNGWWDGYRGQETVVFNDFRGEIPYALMLQLVDKYPMTVKRRGRPPMPFVSKHVIVTSALPPEDVYHNVSARDSIEQLLRRFTVTEVVR